MGAAGFLAIFSDNHCDIGAGFQALERIKPDKKNKKHEKKNKKQTLTDIECQDRNTTRYVIPNNPHVPHHTAVCYTLLPKKAPGFSSSASN